MPSRAYTSFLQCLLIPKKHQKALQCVNALSGLYLISTAVSGPIASLRQHRGVNALSGLYLISTKPLGLSAPYQKGVNALSGLYLISTYPFKNLGFMRFPEPAFAGIYQNILATAVFRSC